MVYDFLPTPIYLHAWGLTTSDQCRACGKTASLKYILTGLQVYSKNLHVETKRSPWDIFAETAKICCETANKALNNITNRAFHYVEEGNFRVKINKHRSSLLDSCTDWHVWILTFGSSICCTVEWVGECDKLGSLRIYRNTWPLPSPPP